MIPKEITKTHVISAIREIDLNRIPPGRRSKKFDLIFDGKKYPPKYALSLANKYANGKELKPSRFSGGNETNEFLRRLGLVIETASLQNRRNITNGMDIKKKIKRNWVATVVLQSSGSYGKTDNHDRRTTLIKVLNGTLKRTSGNGVILFPGGYFHSERNKAYTIFNIVTKQLREKLKKISRNVVVCLGVDGRMGADYFRDQLAIAVSKKGIVAVGRKFHPTEDEKDEIHLAPTFQSLEDGKSRHFTLNGREYFMAVCYDVFGLNKQPHPGGSIILNTIHQFTPSGEGSGHVDFARKGLAGASKRWKCPVFGSVVFFNRSIPQKWPSGVYWNQGNKSIKKWKYKNNPIKTEDKFELLIKEGVASVRIYDISRSGC